MLGGGSEVKVTVSEAIFICHIVTNCRFDSYLLWWAGGLKVRWTEVKQGVFPSWLLRLSSGVDQTAKTNSTN